MYPGFGGSRSSNSSFSLCIIEKHIGGSEVGVGGRRWIDEKRTAEGAEAKKDT